jgi:hypothetical protein
MNRAFFAQNYVMYKIKLAQKIPQVGIYTSIRDIRHHFAINNLYQLFRLTYIFF